MWYCIKWFECTALAYRNFFSSLLIDSSSFIILIKISPSFISISIVHTLCDSFLSSSSTGPCATNVDLLIDFSVQFSLINISLRLSQFSFSLGLISLNCLLFLSYITLSLSLWATVHLTSSSSLLWVFIRSP